MKPEDVADFEHFEISQDGVLTFAKSPNFEMPRGQDLDEQNTNTYKVVVQASDGGDPASVNWFKVTVTVTDMDEDGKLAEWTVNADGEGTAQTPDKLLQFQPDAILAVVDPVDDEGVSDVQWQWYRTRSKTADGTAIDGADTDSYTVSDSPKGKADVGMYLRVVATYTDSNGPNKTAEYVSQIRCRPSGTLPTRCPSSLHQRYQKDYGEQQGRHRGPDHGHGRRQRHTDLLVGC